MEKAIIIYSGGMDSFTLLNEVCSDMKYQPYALSFNYGQRHKKELDYALRFTKFLHVPHKIVDISSINILLQGSALTSDTPVPHGHYEEESMKATVVPNRNMILLSLAIGYAVSIGAEVIYYGAHAGDHAIYPDCRKEFITAMNEVADIANYARVHICAPYINMSKGDIVKRGFALGLDYELSWTCYEGKEKPCGKCGACQERLEAFADNDLTDPLEYE